MSRGYEKLLPDVEKQVTIKDYKWARKDNVDQLYKFLRAEIDEHLKKGVCKFKVPQSTHEKINALTLDEHLDLVGKLREHYTTDDATVYIVYNFYRHMIHVNVVETYGQALAYCCFQCCW